MYLTKVFGEKSIGQSWTELALTNVLHLPFAKGKSKMIARNTMDFIERFSSSPRTEIKISEKSQ
jgi:hypothetical protein